MGRQLEGRDCDRWFDLAALKRFGELERLQIHHGTIIINQSEVLERPSNIVGALGQRLREEIGMREDREGWMERDEEWDFDGLFEGG